MQSTLHSGRYKIVKPDPRAWTWRFVGPREELRVLLSKPRGAFAMQSAAFFLRICNLACWGLGLDHQFWLHFKSPVKSQTKLKWTMFDAEYQPSNRPQLLITGGGASSTGNTEYTCSWATSLTNGKMSVFICELCCWVKRSRHNLFSFSLLPFLRLLWQPFVFPNPVGFDHLF